MTTGLFIGIGVFVMLLLVFIFASYVKAPPSTAYIVSGLSREPRIYIGQGGWRVPFLERLDMVYLGQITVDIQTSQPVPTHDFINVDVDAVAKVRILPTVDGIRLAGKNFLNMGPMDIAHQLQDSLQGNMREIIGTIDLKQLNTDRDGFSDQISTKASPDMAKLGIEILSCNIQNITDENDLIKDLGADNTAKIKKDAAITKANADRDVQIEVAKAKKAANDARVISETAIAEKDTDLELKRAELKQKADTQNAIAAAAYKIQEQEQLKEINRRTIDAEIEKTKREQVLTEERITIQKNKLEADVNRQADADRYKIEIDAAAALEQRKREAEAQLYEAQQRAKAVNAEAEAQRYKMRMEAEGIKAIGEAEAAAIRAKGEAEAQAMEKKAEAYAKYNQAAVLEMMVGVLPEVAKNVAEPLKAIDNLNIYGTNGESVTGVTANVPTLIKQTFDTMSSVTGVDMQQIVRANTFEGVTTKNVNLDTDNKITRMITETEEV